MDTFLQKINRVPLLSKEEELALVKVVKEKGQDCDEMEQLCQSSMRFVVALVAQYQHRGLKVEELVSIGVEGLKKAILTYDFNSDIKFITHAVSMMRQCLEEALAAQTNLS